MIDRDRVLEEVREIIIKVVLKHSIGERRSKITKNEAMVCLVVEEGT